MLLICISSMHAMPDVNIFQFEIRYIGKTQKSLYTDVDIQKSE